MTTAPDYLELPATDLPAAKAFYAGVFGWVWTDYGPGYATAESMSPEVALNASAAVGAAHEPGAQDAVGPFVLFSTDDLAGLEAAVVRHGGTIVTPPYGYPGGRRFHFADPSGNVLGVYQPGA